MFLFCDGRGLWIWWLGWVYGFDIYFIGAVFVLVSARFGFPCRYLDLHLGESIMHVPSLFDFRL